MDREGHENVSFFMGTEVEASPAAGKHTLFVVGLQDIKAIEEILFDPVFILAGHAERLTKSNTRIEHIYFGANQSFAHDSATEAAWTEMIEHFLELGVECTLDLDLTDIGYLEKSGLLPWANFIPMISVKLPNIPGLSVNYNTTIKIDDIDFKATNPGVWCHGLHELMDRSKFTPWFKYTKDTVLKS